MALNQQIDEDSVDHNAAADRFDIHDQNGSQDRQNAESSAAVSLSAGSPSALAKASRLTAERRLRRRFLPSDLFHEPAWDMLLALYIAHHERRLTNVKTLVASADAPVTTSQRWIDHLGRIGLVTRVVDPQDRRRIEVSLSDAGMQAIEGYLAALS